MNPLWQVVRAELRRRWTVHPRATLMATVVFPALTVAALFYLPTARLAEGSLGLRRAAYTVEGQAPGAPVPDWARPPLEALAGQRIYSLTPDPDAPGAVEAGRASAGVLVRRGAAAGEVAVEIHHRDDLVSVALFDALEAEIASRHTPTLVRASSEAPDQDRRDNLSRVALFVLVGFAWFFASSGVLERFVADRERRTLETFLSVPLDPVDLARGRLTEIWIHGSLAQLSCGLALLALGFSPWALLLPLVGALAVYPLAVLVFRLLRQTPELLAAGWRTGVLFMFAFPLAILGSDLLGPLSPAYRLARALSGAPEPAAAVGAVGGMGLLALLAWVWTPRVARGWRL